MYNETHLPQILQVRVETGAFLCRETGDEVRPLAKHIEQIKRSQHYLQIRTSQQSKEVLGGGGGGDC